MKINKRREVEVKFKINNDAQSLKRIKDLLHDIGFVFVEKRIETDFLPDTEDNLLKVNNILLRFRFVQTNKGHQRLLALKKRRGTKGVLDFEEIETDLDDVHKATKQYIKTTIKAVTGVTIEDNLLASTDLEELQRLLNAAGLSKFRILLDKYREEYKKNTCKVTLDFFPDGMGRYLEIEGYTENEITEVYHSLGFHKNQVISIDYGDILKAHKVSLKGSRQRMAQFSDSSRRRLLYGNRHG